MTSFTIDKIKNYTPSFSKEDNNKKKIKK